MTLLQNGKKEYRSLKKESPLGIKEDRFQKIKNLVSPQPENPRTEHPDLISDQHVDLKKQKRAVIPKREESGYFFQRPTNGNR
nr:hypothetical protein [Oxalobacteraceae bacterium]